MSRLFASLYAAVPLAFSAAFAAPVIPEVEYRFDPATLRGDSTRLVAQVRVPEGWHIQSNAPLDSFLIPTELRVQGEGLAFGKPLYPKPVVEEMPALGGKVAVFEGVFEIQVPAKKASSKTGNAALRSVKVTLRYQACNNTQCLPPREVNARFDTSAHLDTRGPKLPNQSRTR
jgi:hypothetical protein